MDYAVRVTTDRETPHMEGMAAAIRHFDCEILIDERVADCQRVLESVFHEVLHGLQDAFNLDLDEHVVENLGRGLSAVMRDNPALVKWIKAQCNTPLAASDAARTGKGNADAAA